MTSARSQLSDPRGLGAILKEARVAQGVSRESMARELNIPLWMLEAMETDAWRRLPAGRERPLARRMAEHLALDLARHPEEWEALPGTQEQEPPDPRREAMEKVLMLALTIGSVGLLVWLVMPGPDLKGGSIRAAQSAQRAGTVAPIAALADGQPYPVLGEVLPEMPVNAEGVLVLLRALDTCECRIETGDKVLTHSLRVSEPWKVRVKGPFTLQLDNAGVVSIEVAGRRVVHGRSVGDAWRGRFAENGAWLPPLEPESPIPPTAPETDGEE